MGGGGSPGPRVAERGRPPRGTFSLTGEPDGAPGASLPPMADQGYDGARLTDLRIERRDPESSR